MSVHLWHNSSGPARTACGEDPEGLEMSHWIEGVNCILCLMSVIRDAGRERTQIYEAPFGGEPVLKVHFDDGIGAFCGNKLAVGDRTQTRLKGVNCEDCLRAIEVKLCKSEDETGEAIDPNDFIGVTPAMRGANGPTRADYEALNLRITDKPGTPDVIVAPPEQPKCPIAGDSFRIGFVVGGKRE